METGEINRAIDKLSYAQLLLHININEQIFDEFTSDNPLKIYSFNLYSSLLLILHQLNDEKQFKEEDLKSVCDFMYYEPMSFDGLIRILTNRATAKHIKLTYSETQNVIQSILFISKNNPVTIVKLYSTAFILPVVMQMISADKTADIL